MTIKYEWPRTKCGCGSSLYPEWADEVAELVLFACRSCGYESPRPHYKVSVLAPSYRPRRSG